MILNIDKIVNSQISELLKNSCFFINFGQFSYLNLTNQLDDTTGRLSHSFRIQLVHRAQCWPWFCFILGVRSVLCAHSWSCVHCRVFSSSVHQTKGTRAARTFADTERAKLNKLCRRCLNLVFEFAFVSKIVKSGGKCLKTVSFKSKAFWNKCLTDHFVFSLRRWWKITNNLNSTKTLFNWV